MIIAITQHAGAVEDEAICEKYAHKAKFVSPARYHEHAEEIEKFVTAANNHEFDAIFFPSALAAEKLGHLINPRLATKVRMIANGPQTAKDLHNAGLAAEMLPFYYSRDLVPYLGKWIRGKKIGIPRADYTYPQLAADIEKAGGIPFEFTCFELAPTNEPLDLAGCGAVLFTSPEVFEMSRLPKVKDMIMIAIGDVTAQAMMYGGCPPSVVGDGSIEGSLIALNSYLWTERF